MKDDTVNFAVKFNQFLRSLMLDNVISCRLSIRCRYECEGRSAGALQGENSTNDTRTYPTIQVVGYQGPAVCVVSLVEMDGPNFRTHPHNLVGRDGTCHCRCKSDRPP